MFKKAILIFSLGFLEACASSSSGIAELDSDFALVYPEPKSQSQLLTGAILTMETHSIRLGVPTRQAQ